MKWLIGVLALFLGAFLPIAALDLATMMAETPQCALPCLLTALETGNCSLTNLPDLPRCACTNLALQASLSACVQDSCIFADQARSALLLAELCETFPKESRTTEVKAISISCLVLTVAFVSLRCLSRFTVSSRLWWDDYTLLCATVFLIGLASVKILAAYLGFGLHYWNVDPSNARVLLQLFYSGQMLYIMVQVTAKVSILVLFSRIFTARWLRLSVWACVAFLVGHGVIFLFIVILQCAPVHAVWDRTIPARCLNITTISWAGAIFSIVEDLVILALPIPEVFKLQLSFQKKLAVCFMFSVGSFACITSIVRLKYLVRFASSTDLTWDNVNFLLWSIIEVACAIICGTLPTLRPLLKQLPSLMSSAKALVYKDSSASSALGSVEDRRCFNKLSDDILERRNPQGGAPDDCTVLDVALNDESSRLGRVNDLEMKVMRVIARDNSAV